MRNAMPNSRKLLLQAADCDCRFAPDNAGNTTAARTEMMAMTTSSSINVNPDRTQGPAVL